SRLYAATPTSIAAGVFLPSIPIWGRNTQSANLAYTPNDFEILGACFRKEVEIFLHELNGIHTFKPDPFFYHAEDLFGSSDDSVDVVTGDSSVLNDTADEDPIPAPAFSRDPAPHLPVHGSPTPTMSPPPHGTQNAPTTINTSRPSAITRLLPSASMAPRAAAHSSSSRLAEMFSRTPPVIARQPDSGPPDDDGSDNGDDVDPRRRPGRQPRQPHFPSRQTGPQNAAGTPAPSSVKISEAHFDHKLKIEIVPTWNGDTTTLARWILRVNAISKKSPTVATQLGTIVPQRLTSDAETWYYSLRDHERVTCETGWQEIRDAIGNHFMNRAWVEKTRRQAMAVRFRDATHPRETPSQYFIRKQELLELVYEYSDAEIIAEVMAGAPHSWKTLLTPRLYQTTRSDLASEATRRTTHQTHTGPLKMNVEAYVVKGMTAPFILGNDFADHSRIVPVQNSLLPGMEDENGHTFSVSYADTSNTKTGLRQRRLELVKKRHARKLKDPYVRAQDRVVIPPKSSRLVPVTANFPPENACLYVEKIFNSPRNEDDVYAAPDTLITKLHPFLHVSNFSDSTLTLEKGQAFSTERYNHINAHAQLIRRLASPTFSASTPIATDINTTRSETSILNTAGLHASELEDDLDAEEPLEGGPKTSEAPPEDTSTADFLQTVDVSEEVTGDRRTHLLGILERNIKAFSLDGRLGTTDATCTIPLRPGSKEVSLPPFPGSPAKREVMDKQMDTWIRLEVIEPSKSPWGAPGFIVYRNGKPRMVIDYRKLNEMTVPDEFPLPKQEDIMNALSGAQWLSTMDALSGFTQVVIQEDDRPKTAFRTHRGLHQFRRMPFGLRNGPSIFQRIMQNVLAPYLWIYALVYIDDIVIYSKTFDEHVEHVDRVLTAVADAGITLSPAKCHFAYRSLMLLGQKVSRLGLSTHKDKVDAIIQLAEPKNLHELQTFLAPLFQLQRKDTNWDWTAVHQEAFDLCKQVLTQAPIRAHPIQGLPYRVYTDACDYGLAAILQQVQPIQVKDLRVAEVSKNSSDVPKPGIWANSFEDTTVHIERVIAYWSRILKSPERNYSPTEREALALKEGDQINDPLKNAFSELGERFEEKLLSVASKYANSLSSSDNPEEVLSIPIAPVEDHQAATPTLSYVASTHSSLVVGLSDGEIKRWKQGYDKDDEFTKVLKILNSADDKSQETYSHYFRSEDGLLYFEDWNGASRLCVPQSLQTEIMSESHNVITEGAHAGYHRTYNRLASTYYWPRMSRDIRRITKTNCHSFPTLRSNKLTKYGIFIPTTTNVTEKETAELFFKHVVTQYGLPRQVITDRDTRWRNDFWKQLCTNMGMKSLYALTSTLSETTGVTTSTP
ncbi:hypothetical protein EUX98_g7980, partial [Antrodiella citrinella]